MRLRTLPLAALIALILASSTLAEPRTAAPASAAPPAVVVPPPTAEVLPPLTYLSDAEADPTRLVPPPARPGSVELARALDAVRVVMAGASPERRAQAAADEDEVLSQFNAAAGIDLARYPATSALLQAIADETEAVIVRGKLFYKLPRPYQVDPSLPHCGKGKADGPPKSYPSGHAGFGYSVGWALARLMPQRAPQILTRAQDFAFSREICGVHFHADTEASRVIATLVAEKLLADPRLAGKLAAARAELAAQPPR